MKGISLFKKFLYNQKVAPYVFVAPFVVTFLLFFLYPVISSVIMTFQNILPGNVTFVGLENYSRLNDPVFFKALGLNIRYTLWTLVILIPFPMMLAIFLNSKHMRARNFDRSTLFIPALTSVVVAGTIFRLVFGELPGALMNRIISIVGMKPIKWLRVPEMSMVTMLLLATWRWTGVNILYFLAGLQNIPNELYEAADIDGANAWQVFRNVSFPAITPILYFLTITGLMAAVRTFDIVSVMTGGGPANRSNLYVYQIYREAFGFQRMGVASALAVIMFVIVMSFTYLQTRYKERWVNY